MHFRAFAVFPNLTVNTGAMDVEIHVSLSFTEYELSNCCHSDTFMEGKGNILCIYCIELISVCGKPVKLRYSYRMKTCYHHLTSRIKISHETTSSSPTFEYVLSNSLNYL